MNEKLQPIVEDVIGQTVREADSTGFAVYSPVFEKVPLNKEPVSLWIRFFHIFNSWSTAELESRRAAKLAKLKYRTPIERFIKAIKQKYAAKIQNAKHICIFWTLVAGVRLNIISESTFNTYCFYKVKPKFQLIKNKRVKY